MAPPPPTGPGVLTSGEVVSWHHALVSGDLPCGRDAAADAERVELVSCLEQLKNAIGAVQGDLAVELDCSQRAQQAVAGLPARRHGVGVAAQLALARQESPHRGGVLLGLAKALAGELPHTRAALRAGLISEYAALLIAQESACLDPEDRGEVDEEVCADAEALHGAGPRHLAAQVRRRCASLDPASVVRRARRAEGERHVSLRPAPDTMTYLSALLPMAQGVAVLATLRRDADALRSSGSGEERGRGQVMADLLVQRVTGQCTATAVPLAVDLVISDASLVGAGHEPALMTAAGADAGVPAQIARELVARALDEDAGAWVRRLYAAPEGELVAMSSRQRFVRGALADFLRVRDQGLCRTPWCEAPTRHGDHVHTWDDGGDTSAHNTQSLCVACNHAKQAPATTQEPRSGPGRHVVETTTPTGHHHSSRAPVPPTPAAPARTALDHTLDRVLARLRPSQK